MRLSREARCLLASGFLAVSACGNAPAGVPGGTVHAEAGADASIVTGKDGGMAGADAPSTTSKDGGADVHATTGVETDAGDSAPAGPCAGALCNSPPAPYCVDSTALRTYVSPARTPFSTQSVFRLRFSRVSRRSIRSRLLFRGGRGHADGSYGQGEFAWVESGAGGGPVLDSEPVAHASVMQRVSSLSASEALPP